MSLEAGMGTFSPLCVCEKLGDIKFNWLIREREGGK